MTSKVKAIPDDYRGAIPYLSIRGASEALEFYKKAFGAVEVSRIAAPEGKIGHAEIKIGEAMIMLADEYPELAFVSPKALGGSPVHILLYVEDVDAFARRATEAGVTVRRPLRDEFYGDRTGQFEDPFGHHWTFSTHVEDVSPEEMEKRLAAMSGGS
ncbi:MAG: VOC family protein [Thermoanaerobaculia bacterium]